MRNQKRNRAGKNRPPLRQGSRPLALLSAIANGAIRITTTFIAEASPYTTGRRSSKWRFEMLAREPNIDIERSLRDWRTRSRYAQAIAELRHRRFAKIVRRDGVLQLMITEEGRHRLTPYLIDATALSLPEKWEGTWFILLFDIPERLKNERDALRKKLSGLGFFQLQRSAFVWPYPCEDIIDSLLLGLGIQDYVTFFTTERLGYHEAKALAYFKLKRKRTKS